MKLLIKIIIIIIIISGGIYWYTSFYAKKDTSPEIPIPNGVTGGFVPLGGTKNQTNTATTTVDNPDNQNSITNNSTSIPQQEKLPSLRLLSDSPVGGYGASTTASTTVIRWIDRGRGNIFETQSNTEQIKILSNTFLPKIYESIWNKNATSFIGSILKDDSDIKTVYAKLSIQSTTSQQIATSTATSTNITPYSTKGKNLSDNIMAYVASPKGDKIFFLIKENNQGVGYTANFDGTSVTKIFTTPLTQLIVDWPEDNTITINTKASSEENGFLYFINPKTGVWKKILGPKLGLNTKISKDAKYVFASYIDTKLNLTNEIYPISTTTPIKVAFRTLADKCIWGNYYKEIIYCAVPIELSSSKYPDDWYKGITTSHDKIWQVNAKNDDARLISPLYDQVDRQINAFNFGLDSRDDFLFFMNKDDLSLWSLDLNTR